ncbi:MAG TPA: tRNA (adenosine(37)-N6)-threonylcarbamoyltransferase complex ATPase subunit type 1 TsaE [Caulobacteraceae bacterium]|jgi:tRNA threonylcarbamoyladenosine biosynthesis protein TsaE
MIVPATGDFRLNTETDTARFGAAVADALKRGEAVCLTGPLGAGKSVLARGLIHKLAPDEGEAPSPTYTLVQFYRGKRLAVAHFDLFRLERADEAFELGLDEALTDGAAVIEWAEKLGRHLPRNRLDIEIEVAGETRRAHLRPHGAWEDRPLAL